MEAFQPYIQTAELLDVSDPNLIFALQDKLRAAGIFTWAEVEQFCTAFFVNPIVVNTDTEVAWVGLPVTRDTHAVHCTAQAVGGRGGASVL